MYAYLEGCLVTKAPAQVIIDVRGVGYEVHIPLSSYNKLGEVKSSVRILTYLHVREDIHQLYGFITEEERDFFRLLLNVSGIGPKMALTILSGSSIREIKKAIQQGNAHFLKTIPGLGKKLAERIIVELKDKAGLWPVGQAKGEGSAKVEETSLWNDALQALISLGFKQIAAQEAIRQALNNSSASLTAEKLIKESLKYVSSK